ncbi:MAG: aminopeptidase N [Hyphomicrobiaceae bacterium]
MKTDTPRPVLLKEYRPPSHLIDSVDLDVALAPTATRVRSRLKVKPNPDAPAGKGDLLLDGEMLQLDAVRLDGRLLQPADYERTATGLLLPKMPARGFMLEITTVCDPQANKALQGLYRSRSIYCTQCEAQGFRRITYFLDRPDVLARYTTRIEADVEEASVLLSNGNPSERGTLDRGRRHFAVWRDPFPKPSYLFALVGGNLTSVASTFTTMSGRKVDLTIYVEPGREGRCGWAMDALKRSMRWDEERFGREYDLDVFNIVAVSDFNMGAMENKGLNIFNDRLVLASPDTATDAAFADIERVIAHEYFHNWTGNRITCRDWFQLCLKEGLTVFRDQEFSSDMRSRAVQRIHDVRQLKARQFPEDAGPLAHPVRPNRYIEINNFYTATVYDKGAEVIRMLQTLLGRDDFRKGMDLYFERHDGHAATVEDFIACFADATGRDLDQFMTWYEQAGTPELVCRLTYDERAKTAELEIEQVLPPTPGQPKKKPLHIPVRIGLLGGNGNDLPLTLASGEELADGVLEVTRRKETFRFRNVPVQPVPSVLRGFSAPVNLTMDLSDDDLAFLMRHDSDAYNRWHAAQDAATRLMVAGVNALHNGARAPSPARFAESLAAILADAGLDPAARAQFLALPTESDLARTIGHDVDPAAIHASRRTLRRKLAQRLGDKLVETYRGHAVKEPYSPLPEQAGKRALANAALGLLSARGQAEDVARLVRHYHNAGNATDAITALTFISALRTPERQKMFDHFYKRWKNDHLVIDHWFALQAASPLPTTLASVRKLLHHPLFALDNPNKVRALIGTFAAANPVNFHRPEGYAFLAEQALKIDAFNPQIAARLLSCFSACRAMEPGRRKAARQVLQKVAKAKQLSRDSTEIVAKMLDESP